MIVAIAAEGTKVAEHFGHCEVFAMYNTENGEYSYLASPDHQPGILPGFLKQNGADVIISGGMGERARMLFESLGISVYVGVDMTIEEAVKLFTASRLTTKDEFCAPHDHGDQDHEHGENCRRRS